MNTKGLNTILPGVATPVITALTSIIIIFNFFSGIVGCVWILIVGGWKLIILSLIAGFIFPYIYTLLALPSMGLGLLSLKLIERKWKTTSFIIISISTFYEKLIIMFWVSYISGIIFQLKEGYNLIPLLLLGYSTVISPLTSMAGK